MRAPAFLSWAVSIAFGMVLAGPLQAQESTPAVEPPPITTTATPSAAGDGKAAPVVAFEVDISAPSEVQELLRRHLELMRYRELADLDTTELERLLLAAERNIRELLATIGYFSPEVTVHLQAAEPSRGIPRRVAIGVVPGLPTQVTDVTITFIGDIVDNDAAIAQRSTIRTNWPLRRGMRFTQSGWDGAKAQALV